MDVRRVAAGLLIAAFAVGCSSSGSTPDVQPSSPPAAALPAGLTPATAATLHGFWKPVGPGGQKSAAYILFSTNGTVWSGSDGCNAVNGHYTLGADGKLTASSGPTTLIGCDNWQGPSWVNQAARVAVSGKQLVLFDEDGNRLGAMVKLAE